jgi:hypothetical protein
MPELDMATAENTEQKPKIPEAVQKYDPIQKQLNSDNDVAIAVMIIFDKTLESPLIFHKGTTYNCAAAGCELARYLKRKLMISDELTA